jgi:CheY-like chemotaxis protein
VVENDPLFGAVLADRLHAAGHEVRRLVGPRGITATAREQQADLVVLDLPDPPSLSPIAELRRNAETSHVPLIVLSRATGAEPRVAALKAGADDYLTQPCDLEELLLRLERLLAGRTASLQVLQGDLANHPLWSVVQYLAQAKKTGSLRLRGAGGTGVVEIAAGEVVGAHWQRLDGAEALLALLTMEEGGFRFDPQAVPAAGRRPMPLHGLLMRSAWLRDELSRRGGHLPPTGQPLYAARETLPASELPDDDYAQLPLERILERVAEEPGIRLFDLLAEEAEAPISVRLAVAWLAEHGVVAPVGADGSAPTTMEISNAFLLDIAVDDLAQAAAQAGITASPLSFLLLAEPEVWADLRRLIEKAPGFRHNPRLAGLVEQIELRRAGSVTLETERSKISLHLQLLSASAQPQVAAVVAVCAGALVWLRAAAALDTVKTAVDRLEGSTVLAASGTVVAATSAAQAAVAGLLAGKRRWRSSEHEPQTFLGLLRLLHPPEAGR